MKRDELVLELNIADFLAEYFLNITGEEDEFSYGLFWDAVVADRYNGEKINIFTGNKQKHDGSFYYEYGLLKAEDEMESTQSVTELKLDGIYSYNIRYENPDEKPVSSYFYTRTRIMAFIQYENETLEVAWEMQEITKQKPVLCLESSTFLFRGALDCIPEAYSKDEYSEEELQCERCPDNNKVATVMKRFGFGNFYECEAHIDAIGSNVGYAIDAAWTWFRTGYVNNFISLNPHTKEINLNW